MHKHASAVHWITLVKREGGYTRFRTNFTVRWKTLKQKEPLLAMKNKKDQSGLHCP